MTSEERFPPGWDAERVRRLIAHYDALDQEQQVAEDEAAQEQPSQTTVVGPKRGTGALILATANNRAFPPFPFPLPVLRSAFNPTAAEPDHLRPWGQATREATTAGRETPAGSPGK